MKKKNYHESFLKPLHSKKLLFIFQRDNKKVFKIDRFVPVI